MKRIIYLTFYFQPDLCAGSFRNSPLAFELAKKAKENNIFIDLYTTQPNRYSTFEVAAHEFEEYGNLRIHRISLPTHRSGMLDQVLSFKKFYTEVLKLNRGKKADLVFASSSRLFTAYLGYKLASRSKTILYLDIRDIFVDTMNDVFKSKLMKLIVLPFLKLIERKTFSYANQINLISRGFCSYFSKYKNPKYSFYTNGIDEEFISSVKISDASGKPRSFKMIVYAGNIGEGQGLHKVVPQAAKELGDGFRFLIIGDGRAKKLLDEEIEKLMVANVIINKPVKRSEVLQLYNQADYLFIHLNDYQAFRKVLPSKIFELATFRKPILAGVSGYAREFIRNEVSHSFVFDPCNIKQLVNFLRNDNYLEKIDRNEFISKFQRSKINSEMVKSILEYIK